MGNYILSTQKEKEEMLSTISVEKIEDLFLDVPDSILIKSGLNIPRGMSELEVCEKVRQIAEKNIVYNSIFRGAGAYDHYIPSIVKSITSKEEFVTAYTPYQAEMSQGILQSIFEYQTMICELTGMDVSNASVYDGASAAAEAVAMCRNKKKRVTLISATSNPDVIATVKTYCYGTDDELRIIPHKDGKTDLEALKDMIDESVSGVYIQSPNFYGQFEDMEKIEEIVHAAQSMLVMGCNPIALAIMKTPAEYKADIAVGEGQPLGLPISYGGPYLGFMATTLKNMRSLPGRIVGQTTDDNGNRVFVLSLQAREQHIKREKASSNICSNEALCALTAAVYMSAMGPNGMKEVANQSMAKAHYLAGKLTELPGVSLLYQGEFFHEFVLKMPNSDKVLSALEKEGILGGLPIEEGVLWCVTEKASKKVLDKVVEICGEVLR